MAIAQKEASELIARFNLVPQLEGGYFAENFKATDFIMPPARFNNELRRTSSVIYYLLVGEEFSAWHRIKSGEVWHYYTEGINHDFSASGSKRR